MRIARYATSVFILFAVVTSLRAQTAQDDPPPFTKSESVAYTLRDDGLIDSVNTVEFFLGNAQAASEAADQELEFRSFFTKLEVLEAVTLKADGRVLAVPQKDIVITDKSAPAAERDSYNLDVKVAKIKFPDVTAGDRIRLSHKTTALREWTPGGDYHTFFVDPTERYTSAKISLLMPANRKVNTAQKGFSHTVADKDGRVLHEWALIQPPKYRASEPSQISPLEGGDYVMISTYADWQAAGNSFCTRADPMAAVTPDIAQLATEITQGKSGTRAQALAIHAWVITNIRYVNIVLGAGGMVPRPVSAIASNRFGDCKDHATLTRALLAAKGIASEYSLINSGRSIYKTFPVPMPSFDHVIVYIPELDLYLDPTAKNAGFSAIPDHLADKPVLRCGAGTSTTGRVPPVSLDADQLSVTTEINVSASGKAKASIKLSATGASYDVGKILSETVDKNPTYLTAQLAANNLHGNAVIASKTFDAMTSSAAVEMALTLDDNLLGKDNGLPTLDAPGIGEPFRRYGHKLFVSERVRDFVCVPINYRETILYRLPPGWRPETVPQEIVRKAGPAEFTARHSWSDGTLKIERSFVLRTTSSVCPAAMAREIAPIFNAAIRDTEARVTFVPAEGQDEAKLFTAASTEEQRGATAPDTPPYSTSGSVALYVHPDHRVDTTKTLDVTIHTKAGAEQMDRYAVPVNENTTVEILEAATFKADGRKLDVPADKIIDHKVKRSGKQRIILFPSVAAGDRLHAVWRIVEKQPKIPGGFAIQPAWSTADRHTTGVRVTLDAPADMKLQIAAKGFTQKVTQGGPRANYEWEMISTPYQPSEFDLLFLIEPAASLKISSFVDWQSAGEAYCAPANTAATVTPEVAALAKQITDGKSNRLAKAKAIFEWIDLNITEDDEARATIVPLPAAETLRKRQGRDNDVVTLLQALLTATGIEAHQAVNDGSRLAGDVEVPDPELGTTIIYLPEFDLYADPNPGANAKVAFGVLRAEAYGRQTLRCGPGKPELIRAPAASADGNSITLTANVVVDAKGQASGTSIFSAQGISKTTIRDKRKSLGLASVANELEQDMGAQGLSGAAKLTALAPGEDEDAVMKTAFTLDGSILGEHNASTVIVGPRLFTRPYRTYARALRPGRTKGFFCVPTTWQETITYHLPDGWTPAQLPKDIERSAGAVDFSARYKWQDNRLVIERRFRVQSADSFCPAPMAAELLPVLKAAERDADERLTFVQAGETVPK